MTAAVDSATFFDLLIPNADFADRLLTRDTRGLYATYFPELPLA